SVLELDGVVPNVDEADRCLAQRLCKLSFFIAGLDSFQSQFIFDLVEVSTIGKTKKNEPLCFGGVVYDRVQLGHRGCGKCLSGTFGSNTSFFDQGLLGPVLPKMVLPVRL